jgi:hypothetical protein
MVPAIHAGVSLAADSIDELVVVKLQRNTPTLRFMLPISVVPFVAVVFRVAVVYPLLRHVRQQRLLHVQRFRFRRKALVLSIAAGDTGKTWLRSASAKKPRKISASNYISSAA